MIRDLLPWLALSFASPTMYFRLSIFQSLLEEETNPEKLPIIWMIILHSWHKVRGSASECIISCFNCNYYWVQRKENKKTPLNYW